MEIVNSGGGSSDKRNNDCYFYYYSTCTKGSDCPYRHEPSALRNETMCVYWLRGSCNKLDCIYRHMEITKQRAKEPCYFETQPGGCKKPHCPFIHHNILDHPREEDAAKNPDLILPVKVGNNNNNNDQLPQLPYLQLQPQPSPPELLLLPQQPTTPTTTTTTTISVPRNSIIVPLCDGESDSESSSGSPLKASPHKPPSWEVLKLKQVQQCEADLLGYSITEDHNYDDDQVVEGVLVEVEDDDDDDDDVRDAAHRRLSSSSQQQQSSSPNPHTTTTTPLPLGDLRAMLSRHPRAQPKQQLTWRDGREEQERTEGPDSDVQNRLAQGRLAGRIGDQVELDEEGHAKLDGRLPEARAGRIAGQGEQDTEGQVTAGHEVRGGAREGRISKKKTTGQGSIAGRALAQIIDPGQASPKKRKAKSKEEETSDRTERLLKSLRDQVFSIRNESLRQQNLGLNGQNQRLNSRDQRLNSRDEYNRRSEDLDRRSEDYDRRSGDSGRRNKDYERRSEDLDRRSEEYDRRSGDLGRRNKDYERRGEDLDRRNKDYDRRSEKLDRKNEVLKQRSPSADRLSQSPGQRTMAERLSRTPLSPRTTLEMVGVKERLSRPNQGSSSPVKSPHSSAVSPRTLPLNIKTLEDIRAEKDDPPRRSKLTPEYPSLQIKTLADIRAERGDYPSNTKSKSAYPSSQNGSKRVKRSHSPITFSGEDEGPVKCPRGSQNPERREPQNAPRERALISFHGDHEPVPSSRVRDVNEPKTVSARSLIRSHITPRERNPIAVSRGLPKDPDAGRSLTRPHVSPRDRPVEKEIYPKRSIITFADNNLRRPSTAKPPTTYHSTTTTTTTTIISKEEEEEEEIIEEFEYDLEEDLLLQGDMLELEDGLEDDLLL